MKAFETNSDRMQAYKLKGKIDQSGKLVLTESIDLAPGSVEVIILQVEIAAEASTAIDATEISDKHVSITNQAIKAGADAAAEISDKDVLITDQAIDAGTEMPKTGVSRVNAFRDLFANAPPVPPDFDPDQAKWEYLKEKYNL